LRKRFVSEERIKEKMEVVCEGGRKDRGGLSEQSHRRPHLYVKGTKRKGVNRRERYISV